MKNVLDLDLAIDPGPHQTHHYSVGRVFALLLFSGERVECQNKTFHFMTFRTRPHHRMLSNASGIFILLFSLLEYFF